MTCVAIGDNIKAERQKRRLTQEGLAREAGITRAALAQYEVNRNDPPIEVLKQIAGALKMPVADLLGDTGDVKPALGQREHNRNLSDKDISIGRTGYTFVPVYGSITAGLPWTNYSDVVDWVELPDWGGEFKRWGKLVEGDSMLPEFQDGDLAIFENRQWRHGDTVHAIKDGEDLFKVFWEERGEAYLRPTNTLSGCSAVGADDWQILGVCIMRIREETPGIKDTREYRGRTTYLSRGLPPIKNQK